MGFTFADLFAGIGGFRLGLERLGWKAVFSSDKNSKCEVTYVANFRNQFNSTDVYNTKEGDIQADVICAGFPCQPYSIAGKLQGFSEKRSEVFFKLLDIIQHSRPLAIFLENVPHLLKHSKGSTFERMLNLIQRSRYNVYYDVLDSADFGVPQSRRRLYIIGFREDLGISDFNFTKKTTEQQPFRLFINKGDYSIPISRKWQYYIDLYTGKINLSDIPFEVPKTRRKLERKDPGIDLTDCVFQMRSSGIRALSIDKPLPTFAVSVSGGGAMIPVYSKERRHLSLTEMKRLMGFPDDFRFPVARTHAIKQLANAVCPPVITSIGSDIAQTLA